MNKLPLLLLLIPSFVFADALTKKQSDYKLKTCRVESMMIKKAHNLIKACAKKGKDVLEIQYNQVLLKTELLYFEDFIKIRNNYCGLQYPTYTDHYVDYSIYTCHLDGKDL